MLDTSPFCVYYYIVTMKKKGQQPPTRTIRQSPVPSQLQAMVRPSVLRKEVRGELLSTVPANARHLSPEERARIEAREKMMADVRKFVETDPEAASRLIRAWLAKGKEGAK